MSHFFKKGDIVKRKDKSSGEVMVVLDLVLNEEYFVDIIFDTDGTPFKDTNLDVSIGLDPDYYGLLTDLEKALMRYPIGTKMYVIDEAWSYTILKYEGKDVIVSLGDDKPSEIWYNSSTKDDIPLTALLEVLL